MCSCVLSTYGSFMYGPVYKVKHIGHLAQAVSEVAVVSMGDQAVLQSRYALWDSAPSIAN